MTDADPTPVPTATPVDRTAALAEGAPKVPRQAIVIGAVVVAVLGLGGTGLEHVFSNAGLNPAPTPAVTPAPSSPRPPVRSSIAAFLGIVDVAPTPAPDVALTDQHGVPVALNQLRGKVVVIGFFDADCADACPVLAAEIAQADADLGAARSHVVFLTVNSDPRRTAADPRSAAVASTGLSALGNWHFLGGSLTALDAVWRHYGVSINVSTATGIVAHNNVLYFVDPKGQLRIRATPVADESAAGTFSLPTSDISRSAVGIAAYAAGLLPR